MSEPNWKLPEDRSSFGLVTFLTLLRIPIAVAVVAILVLVPERGVGIIVALLAMLTVIEVSDGLDGHLARKLDVTSEWGAMLDPYSDSVSRLLVYFGLAASGLVWLWVPLVMAFRDVTVAYCRIIITRTGGSVAARASGKIKAVVQGAMAYAAVLGPMLAEWTGSFHVATVSAVVIVVTLWSIGQYAESAISGARAESEA